MKYLCKKLLKLYQMKGVTLKGNNSVLSFRKDKPKNVIIPLLHVQLK